MKANNKTIIYDDTCPMCTWYTGAFVKTGLLQPEGRKAFGQADGQLLAAIDLPRSKNEIPLIDNRTGQVHYGIDAMLEILGQKLPLIKTIGNIAPIKWFLLRLYRLVTYNRRVIVAPRSNGSTFDCTPDFNTRYRSYFMLVCLMATTLLLLAIYPIFNNTIFASLPKSQWLLGYTVLLTTMMLPGLMLARKTAFEYLGQINMLTLLFFLLCLPLLLINKFGITTGAITNTVYLVLLGAFMLREYVRRMQYAGILEKHYTVIVANGISLAAFFVTIIM